MNGFTMRATGPISIRMVMAKNQLFNRADSFLAAQYQRLVVRRGANRATVAIAHTMLIAIYHMLKDNAD